MIRDIPGQAWLAGGAVPVAGALQASSDREGSGENDCTFSAICSSIQRYLMVADLFPGDCHEED
jgi:hypothetical protein